MSKHDYSIEAVAGFISAAEGARGQIDGYTLSSEELELAWDDGIVETIASRFVIGSINQIKQDLKNVLTVGELNIQSSGELMEDADRYAATELSTGTSFKITQLNAALTMLLNHIQRCADRDITIDETLSAVSSIASANAVQMRLPDYVFCDERGNNNYNYEEISKLFAKGDHITKEDLSILTAVVQTCAGEEGVDLEALEKLIACSVMEEKQYDTSQYAPGQLFAQTVQQGMTVNYEKSAAKVWALISASLEGKADILAAGYADDIMKDPRESADLPLEAQNRINAIKNIIALKDITAAAGGCYARNVRAREEMDKIDTELARLHQIEENTSSGFGSSSENKRAVKDAQARIAELETEKTALQAKIGAVSVSHGNSMFGSYYKVTGGKSDFAIVTEYGKGSVQCSLLEDVIVGSGSEKVIEQAKSLKKDTSQTLEEYLEENYDEDEAFVKKVKKIPIAGDVVGLGYDAAMAVGYMIEGAIDGEDYSYEIFESVTDVIGDAAGVAGTFGGGGKYDLGLGDETTAKQLKKIKSYSGYSIQETKNVHSKEGTIEKYYDQRRTDTAYNKEVDKIITETETMTEAYFGLSTLEAGFETEKEAYGSMTLYCDDYHFEPHFYIPE